MITVHHLNNSRSQRVLWLLEELELPYEIVRYQRLPSILAPPELKKIHPLGKSPVITDGDKTIAVNPRFRCWASISSATGPGQRHSPTSGMTSAAVTGETPRALPIALCTQTRNGAHVRYTRAA